MNKILEAVAKKKKVSKEQALLDMLLSAYKNTYKKEYLL